MNTWEESARLANDHRVMIEMLKEIADIDIKLETAPSDSRNLLEFGRGSIFRKYWQHRKHLAKREHLEIVDRLVESAVTIMALDVLCGEHIDELGDTESGTGCRLFGGLSRLAVPVMEYPFHVEERGVQDAPDTRPRVNHLLALFHSEIASRMTDIRRNSGSCNSG